MNELSEIIEPSVELVITQPPSGAALRVPVTRVLTTIGSDAAVDIRLEGVAPHWAVLRHAGLGYRIHVVATGEQLELQAGSQLAIGEITLGLEPALPGKPAPLALEELAETLSAVEAPGDALRQLLDFVIAKTAASSGAVLLSEAGTHTVAAARGAGGVPGTDAASLLSDTVISDVLAGRGAVRVDDAANDERYGVVPSIVARHLRAFLCLPMQLGERVVGALYLVKDNARSRFSDEHVRDLKVLCGIAVPFLIQLRRAAALPAATPDGPLGDSPAMVEVTRTLEKVAPTDLTVLLCGDTGTGKEVAARALHKSSRRADRPFVAINCSAVPDGLLEAELFGCKKGAFTGAVQDRPGVFEAAHGATLFLDEIADTPVAMQAKLLRVLQEREVTRLGETTPRTVDFRLIAASNRELDAEVAAGRFREDLLFRLREVSLRLPRLADRGTDIALLARLFLQQAVREMALPSRTLSSEAEAELLVYPWPGNVRELRATMRRAAVLADAIEVTVADLRLPRDHEAAPAVGGAGLRGLAFDDLDLPLSDARAVLASRYVTAVLARHGGDREAAARALGISVRSLYRYLA